MNKLPIATIDELANRFCIVLNDDAKLSIIDQLGLHPVNHAEFIAAIFRTCGGINVSSSHAIITYRDLTEYIQ